MNSLTKTLEVAMSLMQQNDKINMIKKCQMGGIVTRNRICLSILSQLAMAFKHYGAMWDLGGRACGCVSVALFGHLTSHSLFPPMPSDVSDVA